MKIKIAAVHMDSILGDVKANMDKVYNYIKRAKEMGAELIVFPEFFTTGFAFSDKIIEAVVNNENPQKKLSEWTKNFNIIIGGSFLNFNGENTLNTFSLTFPSGIVFCHSKDIPTAIENFCYTNGDENNVLVTPIGNIGVCVCFEFIRYATARRMNGNVDLIIGGSCWWSFDINDEKNKIPNNISSNMALNAPGNLAKILEVPVVHASYNAEYTGKHYFISEKMQTSTILGATQFIDKDGNTLKSIMYNEPSGILIHDVEYGVNERKRKNINSQKYWIPDVPDKFNDVFINMNKKYKEYYKKVSKPYYINNYKK